MASVERWQARGWQVEIEYAVAGTFDEVFLSRPGRDVHALVAPEGDEVVVDPGGSREEMQLRSFDDLLDRLAFGWVIRCGEGRPARDKVNRGETLFAGRVRSGDLADTEVTVLLIQPRRGLMRRLCDAVRRSRERCGEFGLAYVYLWPIPGREPNVSWGPGFAGGLARVVEAMNGGPHRPVTSALGRYELFNALPLGGFCARRGVSGQPGCPYPIALPRDRHQASARKP